MRIYPALKQIPDFVQKNGKKNLTQATINELNVLIRDLCKVSPQDKARAFNRVGLIYTYLNDFEKAKDYYYESYSLDHDENVYVNYLITLQRLNQISLAFDEAFSFLDMNLNNKVVFNSLLQMTCKYPSQFRLNKLYEYRNFQTESLDLSEQYDQLLNGLVEDISVLSKYEIDLEYFERYMTLAVEVVNSAFKCKLNIETFDNEEINQFVICVGSQFFNIEDIVYLNQKFESSLHILVNEEELSKDQYFDHLTKISLVFASIHPDSMVAA
ncbi:hypothetical protein L289_2634 [Acinetobacter gerneri DSM 14967 = CIP 107464 = MTCC 9824]|nr:tetratricopeptide repeat protein [Acinetobacter gerneri]EPR82909.1 hypothetical protein L289_2634 [Acinetobacter gerneri DSM 14967 = CIP 107464 = MTCC 9824]